MNAARERECDRMISEIATCAHYQRTRDDFVKYVESIKSRADEPCKGSRVSTAPTDRGLEGVVALSAPVYVDVLSRYSNEACDRRDR